MTRRSFPLFALAPALAAQQKAPSPVKTDDKTAPRDYSAAPVIKAEPSILTSDDSPWQQVRPGFRRKLWFNDRLTMALLEFTKVPGVTTDLPHYHPHDQMSYVIEGRLRANVGGQSKEIGPGGVFIAPSNVRHGIEMLTDKVVLLDVFSPTRDDFRS